MTTGPKQNTLNRRTVVRGAAWAAPAVMMLGAGPAFAASLEKFTVTCPVTPMTLQGGSAVSVSAIVTGDGTYAGGTYYAVNAGQWNANLNLQTSNNKPVTGYYLDWGTSTTGIPCHNDCATYDGHSAKDAVTLTNRSGTHYKGKLSLSTPVACSPQVASAGLAVSGDPDERPLHRPDLL